MSADEGAETLKMSATNGDLHPSTSDYHTLATPGKRKRGSAEEKSQDGSFSAAESQDKEELQENLQNLVEILSKCALPNRTLDDGGGIMWPSVLMIANEEV